MRFKMYDEAPPKKRGQVTLYRAAVFTSGMLTQGSRGIDIGIYSSHENADAAIERYFAESGDEGIDGVSIKEFILDEDIYFKESGYE